MTRVQGTEVLRTEGSLTIANRGEQIAEAHENIPVSDVSLTSPGTRNDAILIDHETVVQTWTPSNKGGLVNANSRSAILNRVGSLCNSRLEYAEDSPEVTIIGDCQQDVDRITKKLSTLDEAESFNYPQISSFPVLETQTSVMLQIKAIGSINDCRDCTTLLPQDSTFNINTRSASMLTMVQDGKVKLVKQPDQQPSSQALLWSNYSYQPYGCPLEGPDHSLDPSVLVNPEVSEIGQWIDRNRPTEYEDAFDPISKIKDSNSEAASLTPLSAAPPLDALSPIKSNTKRGRQVKGSAKATLPQLQNTSIQEPASNLEILIDVEPLDPILRAPDIKPPFMPSSSSPTTFKPGPLTGSASGRESTPSTPVQPINVWEDTIVNRAGTGSLIDVGFQRIDTKKDLRRTVHQKKPSYLISSNSEILKAYEKEAKKVLDLALPRPGPLGLELCIGRLLIPTDAISNEYRKPFAWTQRSSALPRDWTTIFTPRITTHAADIEHVLGLKLSRGKRIFEGDPQDRTVTYLISCHTKMNEYVEIEIKQDGTYEVSVMPQN